VRGLTVEVYHVPCTRIFLRVRSEMIKFLSSFEHVKLILFLIDFGGGGGQAPSSQTEGYLLIPLAGKMI
jgi:hypothetical protein